MNAAVARALAASRTEDAARVDAAWDHGADHARQGVQEVAAGFDDVPFDGCPAGWLEKPFARIVWTADHGNRSVGEPGRAGWTLAADQTSTTVADLAAAAREMP